MSASAARRLSPWLVFCVVYADIGTSVFYVPGILYGSIGNLAALAQVLAILVFIPIARKYAEISARCPDGGGVVSICAQAFPERPVLSLVGGSMISVDYFLTSAISGVAAIYYLAALVGFDKALAVPIACACLAALLWLNIVGLKESASVTSAVTVLKLCVSALLAGLSVAQITAAGAWGAFFDLLSSPGGGRALTVSVVLVGYAETWLAFSGLESGAQLSGAMAEPVRRTASRAMWAVIAVISVVSPALTSASLFMIDAQEKAANPESFIASLAFAVGGPLTKALAVVAATLLLVMACNTAIVGNYHVNSRLVAAGFLPQWLGKRNQKYGTPHYSIAISAIVPMVVIVATRGHVAELGDLYAFCLLGTLMISSLSVDVLQWREHGGPFAFLVGSFTTGALLLAWVVNVVHKPHVLLTGGLLIGVLIALALLFRGGYLGGARASELPATFKDAEEIGAKAPQSAKLLTLAEAVDLAPLERSAILVALRGVNEALLEDAAIIAKGLGEANIYVTYVDEVPGLFLGSDVAPSEEAQRVLSKAYELLDEKHKILALPIWRLSNDTASALAEAARELKVRTLLVGTTKRGAIWHLLRGNILKGLLKELPGETRLLISS